MKPNIRNADHRTVPTPGPISPRCLPKRGGSSRVNVPQTVSNHAGERPRPGRRRLFPSILLGGVVALATLESWGETSTYSLEPHQAIADGNSSGLVSVLNVPDTLGRILDVNVTLDISGQGFGGWNGDLYILLAHEGTASVLVSRPGMTAANSFGYGDNGLVNLTFDDEAALGDFHLYQALSGAAGDSVLPISGTWEPDGRATDPESVLDTDPRTRLLSSFDGLMAPGEWRLFVADLSRGGTFQLDSWELNLTTAPLELVPEPGTGIAFAAGVLVFACGLEFRARRRRALVV